jgi:hypothetical protein
MLAFREIEPQSGSLGKIANISSATEKLAKKSTLLGHAQKLAIAANLVSKRSGKPHRVRFCHAHKAYQADAITLNMKQNGLHQVSASYGGLQTCGSIWACPVCASKIAIEKGQEVLKALQWAKQENKAPVMIALTARHNMGMALADFMAKFKRAWERFSSGRVWRRFKKKYKIVQHIANREVTYGENGWHYHMHLLLFLDFAALKESEQMTLQAAMEAHWMHCLELEDLEGLPEIALSVSAHGNVGKTYLTKIGITISEKDGKLEYEMTSSDTKKGRSIWDILRHSYYGDEKSSRLYIEFVEAMQDTNFLTFSHGFAELLADIELPAANDGSDEQAKAWAEISPYWWTIIRRAGAMGKFLEQAALSWDINHLREYLYSLQDELIDAEILKQYHKKYRFIAPTSGDFAEGIRIYNESR